MKKIKKLNLLIEGLKIKDVEYVDARKYVNEIQPFFANIFDKKLCIEFINTASKSGATSVSVKATRPNDPYEEEIKISFPEGKSDSIIRSIGKLLGIKNPLEFSNWENELGDVSIWATNDLGKEVKLTNNEATNLHFWFD